MKSGQLVGQFFLAGIDLRCLKICRLFGFRFKRFFQNHGLSRSAVLKWICSLYTCCCIALIVLPLRQADTRLFSRLLLLISVSFFLLVFVVCACDGPHAQWTSDAKTCSRGGRCVMFSLPSHALRVVHSQNFVKLFNDSLLELINVLFAYRCSRWVGWLETSSIGCFQYLLLEAQLNRLSLIRFLAKKEVLMGYRLYQRTFQTILVRACWKTDFNTLTSRQPCRILALKPPRFYRVVRVGMSFFRTNISMRMVKKTETFCTWVRFRRF